MKRKLSKLVAPVLAIAMLIGVGSLMPDPVASAAEKDSLGAAAACEGNKLGTVNGCDACVNEQGELHICENNFPDENFRKYLKEGNSTSDYIKDPDAVTAIDVELRSIISLKGIEFFSELTNLSFGNYEITEDDIRRNKVTTLDISRNTKLVTLECNGNHLKVLDVSKNIKLKELICFNNELSKLDISENTELEFLHAINNQLRKLDVSKNINLKKLWCGINKLEGLDISKNADLEELSCYVNMIKDLDVSQNTELLKLQCSENHLKDLYVSKNTKLKELICYNNELNKLDVSNNSKLIHLWCSDNQLSEIDVSKNTDLERLTCSGNKISKLDLSKHADLEFLDCANNQISELKLCEKNTKLVSLYCEFNHITQLDLDGIGGTGEGESFEFSFFSCDGNERELQPSYESGQWIVDMKKIVSENKLDNIKSVSEGDFDPKTGLITFDNKADSFTYDYYVGRTFDDSGYGDDIPEELNFNGIMTVTIRLIYDSHEHYPEEGWHSDANDHWKICTSDGCGQEVSGTREAHSFKWVVDEAATEDAPGIQHEECSVCCYVRSENTQIPQLPHTHTGITHHEAVAATCVKTGTIEYWTCSGDKCDGKYYADAECSAELDDITAPIDPDNHVNTEVRDAVAATEDSEGYTGDTWCLDCGKEIEKGSVVDKLDHKHVMIKTEAKDAVHGEDGNIEYYTCSVCGKKYNDEIGTRELTDEDIVIPAPEHSYSTEWTSDNTGHWHECTCGARVDEAAHSFGEWTVIKEATETADGSRERECAVCGYVQKEVIEAIGGGDKIGGEEGDKGSGDATAATDTTGGTDAAAENTSQTGDDTNLILWLALLMTGGCGAVVAAVRKRSVK